MIKLEHTVVASPAQMLFVVEGMRNPLNSWAKSDSMAADGDSFILGENDHNLMVKLENAGTDHRKFMRMMPVYVRITAPLYWWKEFDTYKVGTVSNSCSTMHKIMAKDFDISDFSTDHMTIRSKWTLKETINELNCLRDAYNSYEALSETTKSAYQWNDKKSIWWQIIQLLPTSFNQTRNVMLNYEVLANIYKSRNGHKLDEWRKFCEWASLLPYSELILGENKA